MKLLKGFTRKDVKEAFFGIANAKSPGLDGYGSASVKASWEIVEEDVMEAILEFFNNGKMLKQLNATNIVLIPKVDCPENASQYRPISCYNVLYKCISKMLCSRLKEAVGHIVADN
ncbi:hypothetical protein P3S67_002122 [Capsicum chacoense]